MKQTNGLTKHNWKIIFCQSCGEPTPPSAGLATEFGFLCDDCMNTNALLSPRFLESSANH